MTTQRNELAQEIFIADNSGQPREASLNDWAALVAGSGTDTYAHNIAVGLLSAGYRKPRTITTAEELDALADGAVILSRKGHSFQRDDGRWCNAALTGGCPPAFIPLPATVLYEPTPGATKFTGPSYDAHPGHDHEDCCK